MGDADIVPPTDPADDHALVKWCAQLLLQGVSESDLRRRLVESSLIHSRFAPSAWKRLIRAANIESHNMRGFVQRRAELEDVDWQRLDSYRRRVGAMDRLEDIVEEAHAMADSVSKLNQVSFMVAGMLKAQDGIDSLTGAARAQPIVNLNINYDPLEQMRHAIQEATIVEIEPVEIEPKIEDLSVDEEGWFDETDEQDISEEE